MANSVEALEELLEKIVKLLHPQNYVVNLVRCRNFKHYYNIQDYLL